MYQLISCAGVVGLMGVAWLFSKNRRIINLHVIGWGLALQLGFAAFIFQVPAGTSFFMAINDLVVKILGCAARGSEFVFGSLAKGPGQEGSLGFILAFQALPTIIFFSALISLLYYFNIMSWIIRGFAIIFTKLMRISGAEALAASSNIFVGVESAFTIQPYLKTMTHSELCTLLTAAMATVASNVLALYVFTLQSVFPTIAGHLVTASLLSAPAAIIMSKLIYPETGTPITMGKEAQPHYEKPDNFFLAIINGSQDGLKVIFGIAALLIAILGLTALVDLFLGMISASLSLKVILKYLAYPFAFMLGVVPADIDKVATLIGEKLVLTEVVAYLDLAKMLGENSLSSPRSAVIAAYALCGFTHIASMAIFVGGVASLAPKRTEALTQVAFRALLAATLACLMTGAVAGIFTSGTSLLLTGS